MKGFKQYLSEATAAVANEKMGKKYGLHHYHEVKHNGKTVGEVHKNEHGWVALHHGTGVGWDTIDSKRSAVQSVIDHHLHR